MAAGLACVLLAALWVPMAPKSLDPGEDSGFVSVPCGLTAHSKRIMGGSLATEGSWPWMGSLLKGDVQVCGATLLSSHWALTASHCFHHDFMNPSLWKVQFGSTLPVMPSWTWEGRQNQYGLLRIVTYPLFHEARVTDIVLLQLASDVRFTQYVFPICIKNTSAEFLNREDCWITGWGMDESGLVPNKEVLQQTQITVMNDSTCELLWNRPTARIQYSQFCAGVEDGSKDTCWGDSGGPLVCLDGKYWVQVGIVSRGEDCGLPNRPGIYVNVSDYFYWIKRVLDRGCGPTAPNPALLVGLLVALSCAAAPGLRCP